MDLLAIDTLKIIINYLPKYAVIYKLVCKKFRDAIVNVLNLEDFLESIIKEGNNEFIYYIIYKFLTLKTKRQKLLVTEKVICYGDLTILNNILSNGFKLCENPLNKAIKNGNLEMIKYLNNNFDFNFDSYILSAGRGNLTVFDYVWKDFVIVKRKSNSKGNRNILLDALYKAIKNNHIEIVKILIKNCDYDRHNQIILQYCIKNGTMETLHFLIEEANPNFICYNATLLTTVYTRNKNILRYLRRHSNPEHWNWHLCSNAATMGYIDILDFLRNECNPPCTWTTTTCSSSITGGKLETLKWLRSQNPPCPWDEDICETAVRVNNTTILTWLKNNHCPCNGRYH